MSPATLLSTPTWTVPLADGDFTQRVDPVGGSLAVSALIAPTPPSRRVRPARRGPQDQGLRRGARRAWHRLDHRRGAAYAMPAGLALLSATQGGVFGLFPIMWIVLMRDLALPADRRQRTLRGPAHGVRHASATTRASRPSSSPSASAACWRPSPGFGAPVAITARDAHGARGSRRCAPRAWSCWPTPRRSPSARSRIPIITAARADRHPAPGHRRHTSAGRPRCSRSFVPLLLVLLVDGAPRGARGVARRAGRPACRSPIAQFVTSNFISVELTDIIASLRRPGRHRASSCGCGRPSGRR